MTEEIVEGEIVEQSTDLVVSRENTPAPVTLFGTDDPSEVVVRATRIANSLADVVEQKKLYKVINGKKYVFVEAWTLLGTMLGVFPVVEWTRQLPNGWEARVQVMTKDGSIVGAAEAECLRSESKWKNSDDYSIRSMAQTRAVSKALRHPLGFVMTLAGYAETPADEMPDTRREAEAPTSQGSVREDQLVKLRGEAERLSGVPGWSEGEMVVSAAQSFKRPITKLEHLTADEAAKILAVAAQTPPKKEDEQ